MLTSILSILCLFIGTNAKGGGGGGRDKGGGDDKPEYVIGPKPLSFDDAEAYCQDIGRHLVSIHSSSERDAAKALCKTVDHVGVTSRGCWIGLSEDKALPKPVRWAWTDGTDICEPKCYGFNEDRSPNTGTV